MSTAPCTSCQKTKAPLNCGICRDAICKSCTQFLEEGHFSFLKNVPAELKNTAFCQTCYTVKVLPEIEKYDALMEKARQINVFDKSQGKETRLIKRLEKPVKVKDCPDYDEALLRLAFFAAELGYNAIIDVDLVPKKILDGSYQKTIWNGSGIPAEVNASKLLKDRSTWSNPN